MREKADNLQTAQLRGSGLPQQMPMKDL